MRKMVEKTEGAEWDCVTCGTHLICRMKDYDGDFKSKLQWQNEDGSAHFSYDGHEFSCNTPPDSDTNSTPDPNPTPPSETPKDDSDVQCKDVIDEHTKMLDEMSGKWVDKEDQLIQQIEKHLLKSHPKWPDWKIGQWTNLIYQAMLNK